MKKNRVIGMVGITVALMSSTALADPWKDESGHGKGHYGNYYSGDHKEEFWDGNCKVERKWEGNGEYKEERKCKGPRYQQPVVVPGYPVYPAEPGIVIEGTAVIR